MALQQVCIVVIAEWRTPSASAALAMTTATRPCSFMHFSLLSPAVHAAAFGRRACPFCKDVKRKWGLAIAPLVSSLASAA